MNVCLYGEQKQQFKACCFIMTFVMAGFCIFPACFLCCDCYRKFIHEVRALPGEAYTALANAIMQFPSLETIFIRVADNYLDASKASVLEQAVMSVPRLIGFTFQNIMGAYDMDAKEYSNFDTYFPQIKQSNRFMYSISWGAKTKVNQNIGGQAINMTTLGMASPMEMTINNGAYPPQHPNPIQSPLNPYGY